MPFPKIVIADDSKLCSHVLKKYIGELGYALLGEAKDGFEAVQLAKELNPSMVILDVYMPRMNGYQACEIIQNKLGIPVVLVTGRTEGSSIDNIVMVAPSGILIKPYTLFQFKSTVELIYAKEKAQINLQRYKNIVQKAPMLFALIDEKYRYVLVNDYYCELFMRAEDEIIGSTISELFGESVFANIIKHYIDIALSGDSIKYESWFDFKGVGRRFMAVTYSPFSENRGGISKGVVVFSSDNTQLKLSEQQLEALSSTDQLTGINNRRKFMELLKNESERATRLNHTLWLLSIDVDNFKSINDVYGHPVGDQALIYVANLLKSSLRQIDTVGRVGGEEFCAIIPEIDETNVPSFLDRLIYSFNASRFNTNDLNLAITVSLGAARLSDCDYDIEILLNIADQALYSAKNKGRNQYFIHSKQ
jgi:diguanylate cyclase (GGDEF)-like protein/PAS domain S-box-containing protein